MNIYDVQLLNSIVSPKTPESVVQRQGIFGGPFRPERSMTFRDPLALMPEDDFPQFVEQDMGATGITPQLAQGIMQLRNQSRDFGTSVDNFQGFTDKEDFSEAPEPNFLQRMVSGAADYLPFIGNKSLSGALLNLLPEQDPRATGIRNFYSPEGLTNTGSIASGIMQGYNPVSGGFLNKITGGRFGQPTQYGLAGAMQNRIEKILGRKAAQTAASREKIRELRNLQNLEMRDRYDRGESLSDIGKSTFSGPGMAFEKQSGGVSKKGTDEERNYGGR